MSEPPFYVGYLRLPKALRRPLALAVAGLLLADAALALALVATQPPRGTGAWAMGEVSFDGVLQARPYPVVLAGDRSILLVTDGKHGAPPGLEALDGRAVTVTGYGVRRGDATVLQLDRPPEPLDRALPAPAAAAGAPRRLTGEIVDAKCWAGAMNPGEGKPHKGCGTLCLLGGIPALLVGEDGHWYLLADRDGGPLGEAARALVGERVTVEGTVTERPGLAVLRLDRVDPA